LTRKLDNVICVAQQLKATFYPFVEMNAEEKHNKRRKKEVKRFFTRTDITVPYYTTTNGLHKVSYQQI
jgi:hypothetical protein